MKITNKMELPSSLVVAASMDEYSKGDADISVTQLIDSPRLPIMQQVYSDVISKDVSEMLQPLLGTAFHKIMEDGADPNAELERRYYAERDGWKISGAIDRSETTNGHVLITDYKVTSVYTVMKFRREWEYQLNCYRWLYHEERGVWPKAQIVALCRDWRPMEKLRMGEGYPSSQIVTIPISSWSPQECEDYISARLAMHQQAQANFDRDGIIAECSTEDRWSEGDKYAVVKAGAARATKIFSHEKDALQFIANMRGRRGEYKVQPKHAEERRCEGYCEYRDVCAQFKKIKEDRILEKVVEKLEESRQGK